VFLWSLYVHFLQNSVLRPYLLLKSYRKGSTLKSNKNVVISLHKLKKWFLELFNPILKPIFPFPELSILLFKYFFIILANLLSFPNHSLSLFQQLFLVSNRLVLQLLLPCKLLNLPIKLAIQLVSFIGKLRD